MLSDGRYSAWFRIPQQEGMGVITLADGKLTGRDTGFAYTGSYTQQGDAFAAKILSRRHSTDHPGIFGLDEVEIDVVGTSKKTTASCQGRAKQCPELPFEVVLVRIID
jgi:hypothetical protein